MDPAKKLQPTHFMAVAGAVLAATLLTVIGALSPVGAASALDEIDACVGFIQSAEESQGIPKGLLMAIGYTESGRATLEGAHVPWPWTVNADGQSHFFETKKDAIEFVAHLQAAGVSVIDVGCMQINLYYHPDAFVSLETAFDPATNVAYAAQFLKELKSESGDWGIATQHYHSRTPSLGQSYAGRVIDNGGNTFNDVDPIKPLSAKERTALAQEVSDHLTADNELIAKTPARWQPKRAVRAIEQPVAIATSGAALVGGAVTQVGGSVD